jgi:hypothetical protein
MRKRNVVSMSVFICLLSFASLLVNCGGGGGNAGGDTIVTAVSENFEYAVSSPWTPINGWAELQGGSWNIVNGGVAGNALQYHSNKLSLLTNDFSGADYTVAASFMPVHLPNTGWSSGLIGRLQDKDNWYGVFVTSSGGNISLQLVRNDGITLAVIQAALISSPLSSSAWYTLTLKCSGTTIVGSITGGAVNTTITVTDSMFATGTVGVVGWNNDATYDVRFDNFRVTIP